MFLPSLSLRLKPNLKQLSAVQHKGSAAVPAPAADDDVDYDDDDEEESQTYDHSRLQNLKDKQTDGLVAAKCSSRYPEGYSHCFLQLNAEETFSSFLFVYIFFSLFCFGAMLIFVFLIINFGIRDKQKNHTSCRQIMFFI